MDEHEFELSVGDVVQFGEYTVTVIDIDGPHVSFRIDHPEESEIATIEAAEWLQMQHSVSSGQ